MALDGELQAVLTLDGDEYIVKIRDASGETDKFTGAQERAGVQTLVTMEALRETREMFERTERSINSITQSLVHFGVITDQDAKGMKNMSMSMNLVGGVMGPFVTMMAIGKSMSTQFAASIGACTTGTLALGASMSLMQAKSDKAKALWAAMTIILWSLTAAQAAYAVAQAGPAAPIMAAAIGASIAAVVAGVIVAQSSSKKSAQTAPGDMTVIQTHAGESVIVQRGSADVGSGASMGASGSGPRVYVLPHNMAHLKDYLNAYGERDMQSRGMY